MPIKRLLNFWLRPIHLHFSHFLKVIRRIPHNVPTFLQAVFKFQTLSLSALDKR